MRSGIAVLCVLAAGVGLAMGSGGFSSVDADRAVTVDVVSDENAYMSLTFPEEPVQAEPGEPAELVTIRNQFTESATFEIANLRTDGEADATLETQPGEVSSGGKKTVRVVLSCDTTGTQSPVDGTVEFDVKADGESVSAETTDEVEYHVTC